MKTGGAMTMKYYSDDSVLQFRWDQVVTAFWSRYPNPFSKHVLSDDVISRKIVKNKLVTKRLISKTNRMPGWAQKFVGGQREVFLIEESIVDPVRKTLTTYTRNIGMKNIMCVDEKCVYRRDQENRDHVVCDRQAWISSGVAGLANCITSFSMNRFKKNVTKAVDGFNFVLQKFYSPEMTALADPTKSELLKDRAITATVLAKERAGKAKDAARERAGKVSVLAKEKAGKATEMAKEKAGKASVYAKDKAGKASVMAKERAEKATELAREKAANAKLKVPKTSTPTL